MNSKPSMNLKMLMMKSIIQERWRFYSSSL